jgi:hypothetical protein
VISGPVPNRVSIQQAVGDFLTSILPPGIPIALGQENRVPEPAASDFVIFTELFQIRLGTNEDVFADAYFTGSVSGNVLTITQLFYGELVVGASLFGSTVQPYTKILSVLSISNGTPFQCALSQPQAIASGPLAAGTESFMQATELTFQIDIHGPGSADNAQLISTLWRDARATYFFDDKYPGTLAPLYADDPRQTPFRNDQDQVEYRWTVDAKLQVNPIILASQQFADQLSATVQDLM